MQCIPPKSLLTLTRLHGVTSQKEIFFSVTTVTTSNLKRVSYGSHNKQLYSVNNINRLFSMIEIQLIEVESIFDDHVAARSKAWTVFAFSYTGIVVSNPIRSMNVYVPLFCICVILCVGSGLATSWSPLQGVLLTVYRIKKLRNGTKSKKQ
jgi:hypothetical protein